MARWIVALTIALLVSAFTVLPGQAFDITVGERLYGFTKPVTTVGLDWAWLSLEGFAVEDRLNLLASVSFRLNEEDGIAISIYVGGGATMDLSLTKLNLELKGVIGFRGRWLDKLELFGDGMMELKDGKFQIIPSVGVEADTGYFLNWITEGLLNLGKEGPNE